MSILSGARKSSRHYEIRRLAVGNATYTIRQFCELFQLSRSTVYRQMAVGEIPAVHLGHSVRIPSWFVEDMLQSPGQLPGAIYGGGYRAGK